MKQLFAMVWVFVFMAVIPLFYAVADTTCNGRIENYVSATGTVMQNGTPSPTNPIEPVFYKQGDIEKGNYYLNAVENSPNKSKKIIKFCEEVRKNKNFYQYREDNKPKKLTFIRTGKRYC